MATHARVAELVDAHDSKSCSARSGGSIPPTGTTLRSQSERGPPAVALAKAGGAAAASYGWQCVGRVSRRRNPPLCADETADYAPLIRLTRCDTTRFLWVGFWVAFFPNWEPTHMFLTALAIQNAKPRAKP